jgi:hypothetical protein
MIQGFLNRPEQLIMILGEMVNLQKVNWPNSQLAKKVNSLKTPNISFWLFYAQVDFLVSWLFGGWPFLLVSFLYFPIWNVKSCYQAAFNVFVQISLKIEFHSDLNLPLLITTVESVELFLSSKHRCNAIIIFVNYLKPLHVNIDNVRRW